MSDADNAAAGTEPACGADAPYIEQLFADVRHDPAATATGGSADGDLASIIDCVAPTAGPRSRQDGAEATSTLSTTAATTTNNSSNNNSSGSRSGSSSEGESRSEGATKGFSGPHVDAHPRRQAGSSRGSTLLAEPGPAADPRAGRRYAGLAPDRAAAAAAAAAHRDRRI